MTANTILGRLTHDGSAILAWALATARASLPAALRNFGRQPDARLCRLGADARVTEAGVRYCSLLGEASLDAAADPGRTANLQLELPETDQYRRVLTVSDSVARRGRAALELRLNEFSPIPVEQASFASRIVAPLEAGGYQVEVSVIRTQRLEQAIEALPEARGHWSIVGAVDASGQPGFQFASGQSARAGHQIGRGPGMLALVAACVLACMAWAERFSREADGLELQRAELISFARGLRDADLEIQRADQAIQAGSGNIALARVVDAVRDLALQEPAGLAIQAITLETPDTLLIEGPRADAADDSGDAGRVRLELPLEDAS
ncbi:hypothetical protein [Maricaulis salignorans]|uniref:hypothetical protein n=1 Tax=Maricaulis salignorans TaxID=144026 RepID=UPI003A8FEE15